MSSENHEKKPNPESGFDPVAESLAHADAGNPHRVLPEVVEFRGGPRCGDREMRESGWMLIVWDDAGNGMRHFYERTSERAGVADEAVIFAHSAGQEIPAEEREGGAA